MDLKLPRIKQLSLKGVILVFVVCFVLLIMLQDLLEANFQNSSFYLSESFLFSSFWWLFIPLLYTQYKLNTLQNRHEIIFKALLIVAPILLHLITFPAVVWLFSKLFYEYTFRYQQTFQYMVSVHLYKLVLFYTLPLFSYHFIKQKFKARAINNQSNMYESTLLVNEGSKHLAIAVVDILYFTANSPYINIHLIEKQYLYNESLKSLGNKIDPNTFVRIHKSTIVNIKQVQSYTSRLNGDYDLTVKDGTILRVSPKLCSKLQRKSSCCFKITSCCYILFVENPF